MKTTEKELSIVELWKSKGIDKCVMEFNCGGDQMNDTDFKFYNEAGEEVDGGDLESYFENDVYNQVEFYVNSDGHYMGESGYVYITLDEDDVDDEGEPTFHYEKDAESEWEETKTECGWLELTDKEITFLKEKISSLMGGEDGEDRNYKGDCILNDEEIEMRESIERQMLDYADSFQFDTDWEDMEWFSFSTIDEELDNEDLIIEGNQVKVQVSRRFVMYQPSEG